jgi:hypothetical protein
MKLKAIVAMGLLSVFLVACSSGGNNNSSNVKEVENIKELVYDYSSGNLSSPSVKATADQLIVTNDDQSTDIYHLPKDEFYVSIAPYINQTHQWTYHFLTGCQAELVNQDFDVYIEDMDGNVVVDETMKSLPNGFIDLWLPRDQKYRVSIKYDGKIVESQLSTFNNDPTCVTTMQLR